MPSARCVVVAGFLGCCLGCGVSLPGCSTPLDSEAYFRLSVASPGGRLSPAKGPFVSRCFCPTPGPSLFVHLDTELVLGVQRVEAIGREIEDATKGFVAGYRAYHAGHDPRTNIDHGGIQWDAPTAPADIRSSEVWQSAFLEGWWLANREENS